MAEGTKKRSVAIAAGIYDEARLLAMVLGTTTGEVVERAVRNELAASERPDAPPEIRQAIAAVRLARSSATAQGKKARAR